tara:strand:+ start:1794 stop:2111 length:318 start_codon:yes stop_codon:yes gene_type:complete
MRLLLFKILFRLTWWAAPNKQKVDQMCEIYLQIVEDERQKKICEFRQKEMDACVQPRTETYEHLTCKSQRDIFTKNMPPRISDQDQPRNHYSDYEEAKAYHEGRQ